MGTFVSALLCIVVAATLVVTYLVVRQKNVTDLENPAERAVAQQEQPALLGDGTVADSVEFDAATTSITTTTTTTTETTSAVTTTTIAGASGTGQESILGGVSSTGSDADATDLATTTARTTTPATTGPPATFPQVDRDAQNFLITGADNGACIDPDSPYAGAFGDREDMGERSDTIMVLRVDPATDRVAILSFPRDLYVKIAGTGNMSRINSAYRRDEPQRLADTIYDNFGVPIDHYIQFDFCAFKTLVDAVGGVSVPFAYPARDGNTGLAVPTSGCFEFSGEAALAYVRSRHYEYEDPPGSGNWQTDGTSDLGRISRQQDFLRRTLSSLLDKGPLNPRVARGLIRAATQYVVTDRDLTPARMIEFAGVPNDVDPDTILTYQIEATPRNVNGNAVLIPNTESENMQAVLALFRGETSLGDAPVQVFEQTPTTGRRGTTTTTGASPGSDPTTGTSVTDDSTASTVIDTSSASSDAPSVESSVPSTDAPAENQFGIVPPRGVTC